MPKHMAEACLPPGDATPPQRDVSLQLVVDDQAWGPPFASALKKGSSGRWLLAKGLEAFPELTGCTVVAFRRRAGPAAFDVVISSLVDEDRAEFCELAAQATQQNGPGQ